MARMFELAKNGLAVITDDGQEVSYAELKARAEALAARMRARSLAFCLCSNTLDSLVGYVACLNHGVDDKMQIFITDQGQVQAVRDFVAAKTRLNFTAFDVQFLASIPKNASGKTLYSELPAP